jgi:hypothetical protein
MTKQHGGTIPFYWTGWKLGVMSAKWWHCWKHKWTCIENCWMTLLENGWQWACFGSWDSGTKKVEAQRPAAISKTHLLQRLIEMDGDQSQRYHELLKQHQEVSTVGGENSVMWHRLLYNPTHNSEASKFLIWIKNRWICMTLQLQF